MSGNPKIVDQVEPPVQALAPDGTSLRVAMIVAEFPVWSETFILNQITGMMDRGQRLDILSFRPPMPDNEPVHPAVISYRLRERTRHIPAPAIPKRLLPRLARVLRPLIQHGGKDPWTVARSLNVFRHGSDALSLRMLYQSLPLLRTPPYDIIHCQFGVLGLGCLWAHQLGVLRGRLLVSFRGFDISKYIRENGERVYDPLFRRPCHLLPNCEFFRRRLLELGCPPEKITVMRSGIDLNKFAYVPRRRNADGRVRITTVARLVEKKGIEYAIRAVAILRREHSGITYDIIGGGPLTERLRRLIGELGVGDSVRLHGVKDQAAIIEHLARTDIFLAPSVTGADGNLEGPPNTLKEALATGLPVISTRHGGVAEVVQDGVSGFLVEERSPEAIADRLRFLLGHPDRGREMGQAGRAYIEQHYDLERLNDQLLALYRTQVSA